MTPMVYTVHIIIDPIYSYIRNIVLFLIVPLLKYVKISFKNSKYVIIFNITQYLMII